MPRGGKRTGAGRPPRAPSPKPPENNAEGRHSDAPSAIEGRHSDAPSAARPAGNGWGGRRAGAGRKPKAPPGAPTLPTLHEYFKAKAPTPADPAAVVPFPGPAERKARKRKAAAEPEPPAVVVKGEPPAPGTRIECPAGMLPREFFLSLMRNADLPLATRRDAGALALPYCHPKIADVGKKEQAELDARRAERGSEWDGLLN